MKLILTNLMVITLIVGCASQTNSVSPESKNSSLNVKEDVTLGGELPEWTNDNGINGDRLVAVGYSEMTVSKSPHYVEKAALMDGETKLLADAPQDFRVITQNALTGAGIDSSEFVEIQTRLKEVLGVRGFKHHQKECRKLVRYTENNKKNVMRGCWYRVSADLGKLQEAYKYILAKKYGQGKAGKFDNLMEQELKKINNHKRFD